MLNYKLLVFNINDEGKDRGKFESFFMTQTWERLKEVKSNFYSKRGAKPSKKGLGFFQDYYKKLSLNSV